MSSGVQNTDQSGEHATNDAKRFKWVKVWDIPTRLFHWLLVGCVAAAWYVGDNRNFNNIGWHFYLGYAVGGLVMFRLIWGLIGPPAVRLSGLFHNPISIVRYAITVFQRSPSGTPGHNPLGSLSILALLLSLSVQVVTGLFAYDDGLFNGGPLYDKIPENVVLQMNTIHGINANILLALIVLHIFASLFYLIWKRENIIVAMITGRKLVKFNTDHVACDE